MKRLLQTGLACAAAALAVGSAAPADTVVAPSVTTQPEIAVVHSAGGSASFTAAATGSPTPTVQWQESTDRDGVWANVNGATDTTLTLTVTTGILGHAYRAVFTNTGGTATTRPAKLVSTEDWMRDLGNDIADVPLTELTIPGSHDTGTYGASGNGDISKDHQTVFCEGPVSDDSICNSYAKAQDRGMLDELNDGIRYFDLRVCGNGFLPADVYPPDFVAISGDPVTCHELVSAKLGQILFQASFFAGEHPDEVIYLDINHLFQVNPDMVANQVEQAFTRDDGTSMLIPPQYCQGDYTKGTCAGDLTLRKIREQHLGNVIVNFENDGTPGDERCWPFDTNPLFHPGCTTYRAQPGLLPSFWLTHSRLWGYSERNPATSASGRCTVAGAESSCFGNDSDAGPVLSAVLDQTANRQTFAQAHPAYAFQHFFVQFLQTTGGGYILGHLDGSLFDMAHDSNPVIGPAFFGCGDWGVSNCYAQVRPENVNIIALNFYNLTDYLNFFDPLHPFIHFDFVREVVRFDEYARTPPVVTLSPAGSPAATGWYNAASLGGVGNKLTLGISAADYRWPTGITALACADGASTVPPADAHTTASTETADLALGDGVHRIGCNATDGANQGTHQVGNNGHGPGSTPMPVVLQVDSTPPVITCPTGALLLHQPVESSGTVTDATSGIATSSISSPVSTASVGSFTTTLTATDKAGNTAGTVCPYTVSYRIVNSYDPTKLWSSGSTVPIKVELDDYFYKDVSDKSIAVTAKTVTNTGTGTTRLPTSPGATNPGFLFYVSPTKGYQYNVKTTGFTAGSYTLDLVAGADPITHHAAFLIH